MGVHYGVRPTGNLPAYGINANGLVFYIDAANSSSYPGSGTSWTDLTGTAIQAGALQNSPTYSSAGYFTFNGTNNYVNYGNSTLGVEQHDKTMCAWIYPTAFSTSPIGILDKDADTTHGWGFWLSASGKLWFWPASNLDIIDSGSASVSLNTWNFVSVSWSNSGKTAKFYYNGTYSASGTTTGTEGASTSSQNLVVGTIRNGSMAYFTGRIANVALYNRVLSDAEILANFNLKRSKFGK